jgi:hypothetical protein
MIDAIVHDDDNQDDNNKDGTKEVNTLSSKEREQSRNIGFGKKLILIDHEDSFVHTLGNYLRQTGAEVETLRSGPTALATIESLVLHGARPDMVRENMILHPFTFCHVIVLYPVIGWAVSDLTPAPQLTIV